MPRQIALVITEIQGIEQLLAATSKTAPDRPAILRRLAESYVELTCGTPSDTNRTRKARSQAIDRYTLLKNEYPNYPAKDEVLYYLALEYELAGDLKNARSALYDLIRTSPQSKYIPNAYFGFGELFYAEIPSDPSKAQLAEQAFLEVIKFPAPKNEVFPDALLRLGQVAKATGDAPKATQYFTRLKRDFPTSEAARTAP
jgi:TolA-binding protein